MAQLALEKAYLTGAVALLLAACAAAPPNSKPLAPRFYGVWSNAGRSTTWLEIDSNHFVSFGVTPSNGHCSATRADVVARDRVVLPVSPIGIGPMSISLDGAVLVVAAKNVPMRYMRSSREAICREPGGNYLPGAPYP